MSYTANSTLQITFQNELTSELCVHEDRGDGTPVCGQPPLAWEGKPATYTLQGAQSVDCGRCAWCRRGQQ